MKFDKDINGALAVGIRQMVYMVAYVCVMLLQHIAANHWHEDTYAENGLVENMQFAFLVAACVVFLSHALILKGDRTIQFVLSGLCALGACREMDRVLDALIPVLSWKVGILFVIVPLVFALMRRNEALECLAIFLRSRCFTMLCAAFTIVLVLAQLIGHKPYLKAVFVDMEHFGTIKEMVEESIETIGYVVILLASVESWFEGRIAVEATEKRD